jgi:transposase-like protein
MMTQVLHCPYCRGTDIVRHGTTPEGKQRYRCRACPEHGRTFLLAYSYAGQSPNVKQQIVEMAMNASGIRHTARVLHVSPTTVLKELKKEVVFQKWRWPFLHCPSKGISIHKQANDDVVHLGGFREADRLANQAFDPCP